MGFAFCSEGLMMVRNDKSVMSIHLSLTSWVTSDGKLLDSNPQSCYDFLFKVWVGEERVDDGCSSCVVV